MYREFFNAFPLVESRGRAERRQQGHRIPLLRRLTELSVPGPPGMADHAMQVLALREPRKPKRRG